MTGFNSKRQMAANKLQEPYDQTALELCNVCGWKTLIPDDCCLNCERAQPAQEPVREALKLATDGLERILGSFEKDGKVVMKSMIRNELFAEMHLLLKKAKKALAKPAQRPWVGLTGEDFSAIKFPAEMRFPAEFRAGARWADVKLKEKNT